MIIKILTGLEKRVEGISQTINTEIRNNRAEIKGSINKIRNMLNGMNSRLEEAEEQIINLEDRVMESNQEQKRKIIMQNKNRHKELSDSIKHINIHILGVPEEEREKGEENLFEEIIAENVPKLG